MPKHIGGYISLDLKPFNVRATNGSATPVTVSREAVETLRQWDKPVMLESLPFSVDGSSVQIQGYTFHTQTAGVHSHICGNFLKISVTGDTQITVTLL